MIWNWFVSHQGGAATQVDQGDDSGLSPQGIASWLAGKDAVVVANAKTDPSALVAWRSSATSSVALWNANPDEPTDRWSPLTKAGVAAGAIGLILWAISTRM